MTETPFHSSDCDAVPILRFAPILVSKIWGGDKIARWKGSDVSRNDIGESWEISGVKGHETRVKDGRCEGMTPTLLLKRYGERLVGRRIYGRWSDEFPLLIKYIDAEKDLSVQVHPDDRMAQSLGERNGKTEMWYVVAAEERSRIHCGFVRPVSESEYRASIADDRIVRMMQSHKAKAGDCFFIPAGRIHAIGGGTLVAEIQQTSDATYRIYDYNRRDSAGHKRELHTDLAARALRWDDTADSRVAYTARDNEPTLLVRSDKFVTSLLSLTSSVTLSPAGLDSFIILMCIDGEATVTTSGAENLTIKRGDTVLLPAATPSATLAAGSESAKLLVIHM